VAQGPFGAAPGLVTVAVPDIVQPIVAAAQPCALTLGLPSDPDGRLLASGAEALLAAANRCSVAAIGPGLGIGSGVQEVVTALVTQFSKPIVLDADGLNVLSSTPQVLRRDAPLVITPHPGEMARLIGAGAADIQASREAHAVGFAREFGVILVLKGHESLVTDGRRLYRNTTGNPGMATGGTGDVLTGLIAALIGQGLDGFAAAQLGVHLHGLAGDFARDEIGEVSLIATDLLAYLPRAFRAGR
jgi:NAD(P)H-hydrate epimerase